MPTYQYECDGCDHAFEVLQSMSDPKLKECPECQEPKLQRLIGPGAGIIFKGSGFYETDYKKKAPSADEKKSSDSPTTPKTEKKESKPSQDTSSKDG